MKVSLRMIHGPWSAGWVLDKHIVKSTYIGDNAYGHPQFDTERTEVGEATYRLKYRNDWSQAQPLAQGIAEHICSRFHGIGFIVPMPASTPRPRQPVNEVTKELGKIGKVPVFEDMLLKAPNGKPLKDLTTKAEKTAAIGDSFSVSARITNHGRWNVLVVDDLYATGASMEAACRVLRLYPKVANIYVAALTWK